MPSANNTSRGLAAVVSIAAGLAISALFLWLAARNVEWSRVWAELQTVRPAPLLAGLAAAVATYVAMAYRWRLLLQNTVRVSMADTFDFTTIGFLAGLVMPQRLGDVVKVVLLARRGGVSRTTVLGTVVLERLTDVIMLLLLAAAFALTIRLPILLEASLVVLATATIALIFAIHFMEPLMPRLNGLGRVVLPERIARIAEAFVLKLAAGLRSLRGAQFVGLLITAALVWLLAGIGMIAYVEAFGLVVPWYAGLLVILLTNLGGILPSSPGSIGVYHYMAVLALTTFGTDRTRAMTFALVTHALAILVIVMTGLWGLARQGLSLRDVRGEV